MRSLSPVFMSFGIGLGGITAPMLARAQPVSSGTPKDVPASSAEALPSSTGEGDTALRTVEARRRYQEGNAAMKLHQWQRAYDAYLAAWRQRPHWQVAGSLGQVELKLDKHRAAALHLAFFLREAKDVAPEELKHVREWLEQARAKVGALTIKVEPAGSEILIDGLGVGQAPLGVEVFVEPGKHLVEARFGQCATNREVESAARSSKDLDLRCDTAPLPGSATVAAAPPLGRAGRLHTAKQPPPSPHRKAILISGAGVTLAALGLGLTSVAVFTAAGSRAKEDHEPASGPSAKTEADFKSVAVWSFVAAGLVGGATIVYGLKTEPRRPPPVTGSLFVGPTGASGALRVEF